jgi:hypothetical protein
VGKNKGRKDVSMSRRNKEKTKKVIKHKRWCDSTDYIKDMAKSVKPLTNKQKAAIKLMFDNLKDF